MHASGDRHSKFLLSALNQERLLSYNTQILEYELTLLITAAVKTKIMKTRFDVFNTLVCSQFKFDKLAFLGPVFSASDI